MTFPSVSCNTEQSPGKRERNKLAVKAFSMNSATVSLQHDYDLIGIADLMRQLACPKY